MLTLTEHPRPPVAALVALADVRRLDGKRQDAIDLLSKALERSPNVEAIRRALLDLLKQEEQYGLIQSHAQYILEQKPDEPFMRLDLAQAFDRQGKTEEAKEQVERFRQLRLGDEQRRAWRYLRGLGLGKYVDADSQEQPTSVPSEQQLEPSATSAKP